MTFRLFGHVVTVTRDLSKIPLEDRAIVVEIPVIITRPIFNWFGVYEVVQNHVFKVEDEIRREARRRGWLK